ncbi:MAG: tRNA dihydrouridine synthase DusB [Candidatus Firestonebacteria bacterium]
MAGVTDIAFRSICKKMGASFVFTEMVSAAGVIRQNKKTLKLIQITEEERPVGIQIFGNVPNIMAEAVSIIGENADIIDINFGCPAKNIVRNNGGASLLKEPQLIGEIVKAVVQTAKVPVTAKIRIGWDDNAINAIEISKIIEDAGAKAITVHARTYSQGFSGKADWNVIKNVKSNVKIPVIGNGDIKTPEDAKRILEETGCDGIMIGRASLGNPWIFKRIIEYLKTGEILQEPTLTEIAEMIIEHFNYFVKIKGELVATREIRKHIGWYVKGIPGASELRQKVNVSKTKEETIDVLNKFFFPRKLVLNYAQ